MLVQHVNHAVANTPEQKQRGDQQKKEGVVLAVGGAEQAFAFGDGTGIGNRCNHGFFGCKVCQLLLEFCARVKFQLWTEHFARLPRASEMEHLLRA
jgi:hypothetical protein